MSYNSLHHQEVFQYGYPSQTTYYVSDHSPLGTGDESNFWSSSPRSDSPSPSSTMQNLVNPYPYFTSRTPNDNRPSQYRPTPYQANVAVSDNTTPHVQAPYVRVVKRRTTANKKERRRTQSINNAYADLRECIPNVPSDTKLSKIKTLRLATSYINYLVKVIKSNDPAGGFTAELGSINRKSTSNPVQVNDCSTDQIPPNNDISEDMNKTTKAKGRTGWPQHVWALELK